MATEHHWDSTERRIGTFDENRQRDKARRAGIPTAKRVIGKPGRKRPRAWTPQQRRIGRKMAPWSPDGQGRILGQRESPMMMAIDDDRLDTTEGVDLVEGVRTYLTAHPASATDTWFTAVKVFDILTVVATELAPDAVSYDNLTAAEFAILFWVDENKANRPARYQLDEFLTQYDL